MKNLLAILIVALLASASFAQEAPVKEKKGNQQPWQIKKTEKLIKDVTLTEEQDAAFAAAGETLTAELKDLQEKGLTKEMIKSRDAKRKEAREAGIKGKDMKAHLLAGMPEEEGELFASFDKSVQNFEKTVAKMLTPEQIATLPEKAQKRMSMLMKQTKGRGGNWKGKKKGTADEDAAQ